LESPEREIEVLRVASCLRAFVVSGYLVAAITSNPATDPHPPNFSVDNGPAPG